MFMPLTRRTGTRGEVADVHAEGPRRYDVSYPIRKGYTALLEVGTLGMMR